MSLSPVEILERVHCAGVRLRVEAGSIIASPKESVTPEMITLLRQNKPALIQALTPATDSPLEEGSRERRRQIVRKMLADNPQVKRAVYCVDDTTDPVIITVAVRGKGTLEVLIPKSKYDGFEILKLATKNREAA